MKEHRFTPPLQEERVSAAPSRKMSNLADPGMHTNKTKKQNERYRRETEKGRQRRRD